MKKEPPRAKPAVVAVCVGGRVANRLPGFGRTPGRFAEYTLYPISVGPPGERCACSAGTRGVVTTSVAVRFRGGGFGSPRPKSGASHITMAVPALSMSVAIWAVLLAVLGSEDVLSASSGDWLRIVPPPIVTTHV